MSLATRDRLETIASGFMPARILITAVELDLFSVLGKNALTAEKIAEKSRTHPGAVERLLNALVGMGVLTKSKRRFRNTAMALTHLMEESPEPLKHIMLHRGNIWQSWTPLTETVRKGKPPKRKRTPKQEDSFIRGMADIGIVSAAATARLLGQELKAAGQLLDVGGGPAVYACEFAKAAPGLKITVLDLPGPLKIARQTIAARGMEGRVTTRKGDALKGSTYGKGYDIVFMSNLIHSFKRDDACRVIRNAASALNSHGHLIVKDFFIRKNGTAPTFAALFSINMLSADAGDCYSRSEVETWMSKAGLKPAGFVPVAAASALLIGVKH